MKHALSVDVEDWFQVLNMAGHVDRSTWDSFELRCGESTRRLLALFERRRAKATFFFLGWIAERLPDLLREVRDAGHEIASHGYDHQLIPDLGEAGFREDLRRTNEIIQDIAGVQPKAFRACTWSVTRRTPWAFDALAEAGFTLDSSIYPVSHPDYGVPGAPATPYRIASGDAVLDEFPPLTLSKFGRRLPVGGGGYLRLFPVKLLAMGLRQQAKLGWPGCIYLHPWEVDPGQPRQDLGGVRGFRHYVNLAKTEKKLDALLQQFEFVGLEAALGQVSDRLQGVTPRRFDTEWV